MWSQITLKTNDNTPNSLFLLIKRARLCIVSKLFVIFEDDANNCASSAFFLIPEMTFELWWRPGANIRESKVVGNIICVI